MANIELTCPICGEQTSSYMGNYRKDKLCRRHAKDYKMGLIEIDEDGLFIDVKNGDILNADYEDEPVTSGGFCVVCGAPCKSNHYQCRDCYYESRDYMDGIDGNATVKDLRTYYYNLKDYIFRLRDKEWILTKCNNLIAIAVVDEKFNDDRALINRVYKDVAYIIEKKAEYLNDEIEDDNEDSNKESSTEKIKEVEKKVYFHYSNDGHALDSDMEVKIDDCLFDLELFHSCHKPVMEVMERDMCCDWFIPIESINKGIYIEYWGMDTPKYKKDKQERIELYRKYDLPLVEIQKDEPNIDSQTFRKNLMKEIQQRANEYYRGMPVWHIPAKRNK